MSDSTEPSADDFREDLKSEYNKDFDLKQRLDAKASAIVTMSGIISAILTTFGTFLLRDIPSPNLILFGSSIAAMLIGLGFLIATIWFAHRAIKVAGYEHVLMWSRFIENDKYNNEKIRTWKRATKEEYNNRMIKDYLSASKNNSELNDKKAQCVKDAETKFLVAIITIPVFVVLAMATKLLS